MVYQEDLREKQVVALWVGDIPSEDALGDYLGTPFEDDVGFLLDDDALPEFACAYDQQPNPPDLNRKTARYSTVPFDRDVEVRKLLGAFSHSEDWISEAIRKCEAQGIHVATMALAFGNLRYRHELCRNPHSPLRFVGNVSWPGGLALWEAEEARRVVKPPFPKLIREELPKVVGQERDGETGELAGWRGIVRLDSWKGFATYAELSSMNWSPTKGCVPDGDFRLSVSAASPSAKQPSGEQARAFGHLMENEIVIRDAVLEGIFKAYPEWRENYFGDKMSSDGGKTWQSGWDLPELYPPESMPAIASPDELRRLISLSTVHVMANGKDGLTRIGFSCYCKWDEEHGLGVSTHGGKVIKVGSAEESFAEYYP